MKEIERLCEDVPLNVSFLKLKGKNFFNLRMPFYFSMLVAGVEIQYSR